MSQDFANRSGRVRAKKARSARSRANSPAKKAAKAQSSAAGGFSFASFVAGVVTGVAVFLLGAYAPEMFGERSSRPLSQPQEQPQEVNDSTPKQKVEYVFHELLGEDKVAPDISAYETGLPAQQSTPGEVQYLLQSGSFLILPDAERRRGELLLMDLPANVVEARIENKTWYRVLVGPFSNRDGAQQVVTRLRDKGIAAIWLERPQG
jgi:cell division protein FtsN